jgi:hypothetical protein
MATRSKATVARTRTAKTVAKRAAPAKVRTAAAEPAKAASAALPDKPRKPKLVRDSFTIPKDEYAILDQLKQRAAKSGAPAKKSEILRGGIKALASMSETAFVTAMRAVPPIKTGRPAKK